MKIPGELIEKWELLYSDGDYIKIADKIERSRVTVAKIFTTAQCSDEQFELIADFYKEKEDLINQYL
jgi:hypothetical protein